MMNGPNPRDQHFQVRTEVEKVLNEAEGGSRNIRKRAMLLKICKGLYIVYI
jgi:hypothetical protein